MIAGLLVATVLSHGSYMPDAGAAVAGFALGESNLDDQLLEIHMVQAGDTVPQAGVWMEWASARALLQGMRNCETERTVLRQEGMASWVLPVTVAAVAAGALGAFIGFQVGRQPGQP